MLQTVGVAVLCVVDCVVVALLYVVDCCTGSAVSSCIAVC